MYLKTLKLLLLPLALVGSSAFSLKAQTYVQVGLQQPPLLTTSAGLDQQICQGDSTNIGDPNAPFGGTAPYTAAWTPTIGISDPTVSYALASPLSSSNYSLLTTDANGCTAIDEMILVLDTCVSISQPWPGFALELFPNPSSGRVRVEFRASEVLDGVLLQVVSTEGKLVFQRNLDGPTYSSACDIDLSAASKGIYFVTLRSGGREYSRRLIIQ